jgi:hypothetical protein
VGGRRQGGKADALGVLVESLLEVNAQKAGGSCEETVKTDLSEMLCVEINFHGLPALPFKFCYCWLHYVYTLK